MLDEISWKLTLPFQLSQIVPTLTDCENRTENEMAETQNWRHGGSRLSRLPYTTKMLQENDVEIAGTWWRRPFVISPWKGSVFVGGWLPDHASTPCCESKWITKLSWYYSELSCRIRFVERIRCAKNTNNNMTRWIYKHIYIDVLSQ